jgi:hypothetical protein
LNNRGKNKHPCLIPNFRENSAFTLQHNVNYWFVKYSLHKVEVWSL